ncbi:GNAT family N-acetyltransferase [Paenibacillus arenilitoris]|uniref:GNAT family N-acetyltransferase n=1 Tax=Paenibacillus arenilitoris TaxID=2772299 RepID=A0A927CN53_9BACL|nr:GNAT family N-acetyltransferase [Paenibacillus arenilitoris]MBD2870624.1 GNAT family N-acetyltransferase [Paenibacillus arenilitoris]
MAQLWLVSASGLSLPECQTNWGKSVIRYEDKKALSAEDVSRVFQNSGIRRPFQDLERIQRMLENSDIVLSAWDGDKMVGIARAITDFSYCCYLSDLAVDREYQKLGIGKAIVDLLRQKLGEEVSLVLLSSPESVDFYSKIGFTGTDKCYVIGRAR